MEPIAKAELQLQRLLGRQSVVLGERRLDERGSARKKTLYLGVGRRHHPGGMKIAGR
jgi:hypothetical protein